MFKNYIKVLLLVGFINLSFCVGIYRCHYVCDIDGCKVPVSNWKDAFKMNYCTNDTSNNVNVSLIDTDIETPDFPAFLRIKVKPPSHMCKYIVTLYVNESVKEESCNDYNFSNINNTELHSSSIVCFEPNNRHNKTEAEIFIPYIFTGCYGVQFDFRKNGDVMKSNKFLKTNYKRPKNIKPILTEQCSLKNKTLYVTMQFTVPAVTAVTLKLKELEEMSNGDKICQMDSPKVEEKTYNILGKHFGSKHQNTTVISGSYYKGSIELQTNISQKANYCATMILHDLRCENYNVWKLNKSTDCEWYIRQCQNIITYPDGEDKISDTIDVIVIISCIVTIIVAIMCLRNMICFYITQWKECKEDKYGILNMRIPRQNKVKINTNADIILLYPKGSESFMALMVVFREVLGRICQCVIHDWYDGTEWNHVAKLGAFDWFGQMLHKECHVVWIDTLTVRLLINNTMQSNAVEIGDFRDAAFPAVFNLCKRNIEQQMQQGLKHFIVRIKGLDSFKNDDDPFVDLSARVRYLIPKDINLLCTDLCELDSNTLITHDGEDLLKQHLYNMCLSGEVTLEDGLQ